MKTLEELKGLSREERQAYLKDHVTELKLDSAELESVTGGAGYLSKRNPDSDSPDDKNNWCTSMGYVCNGKELC